MHNEDDAQSDVLWGCSKLRKFKLSPPVLGIVCSRLFALLLIGMVVALPATASAASLPGVWLMGTKVAIQMFDCSGLQCGRVIWLNDPLDAQGLLKRDTKNPDPALRQRQVCGPTIIWNLHTSGLNRWEGGWFYNPDDGRTYRTSMELKSADLIIARIYLGLPIFGETRTLGRVPQRTSVGCAE
jgi:uncharacterized protein (DUF2147 family)